MDFDKEEGAIVTWTDSEGTQKATALKQFYQALEKTLPICQAKASNQYMNVYPGNVSIRDEYTSEDYETYRPNERIPTSPKGKIRACMETYERSGNGIIRNIVDLMADFAVQGIDLANPRKREERFMKEWFHNVVQGGERSERIANMLVRTANVIVKRETGLIPLKKVRQFYKTEASPTTEFPVDQNDIVKREIPVEYNIFNPLVLDVKNGEYATFVDSKNFTYSLIIPPDIIRKVNFPSKDSDQELISKLPSYVIKAIREGKRTVDLDPGKISSIFYKKDDWKVWAVPMIYSVLKDLNTLEKMKLTDLSALDGAISQIRIWKLGSLDHKIIPPDTVINRLAETLVNGVGGGILDIIWGPDLEFQEVTSSLHNFLGETKYIPILNQIYAGLGIPPLFSGASSQGSFTNNFIAIKTLIERLEYIRRQIKTFWVKEFRLIEKAMGFKGRTTLTFDRMTLNDESSVLTLLLNLVDRNLLSIESVQEMVGANPEIEQFRINREQKEIEKGRRVEKIGPYSSPQQDLTKSFVQMGEVHPNQVGLKIKPKNPEDKTPNENKTQQQMKIEKAKPKPTGVSGQGRPKNKKDTKKRKKKTVKPRRSAKSFIETAVYAEEAQAKISDILTPMYLESINKKNLRQLTEEEGKNFEKFKFTVLANVKPGEEITKESLLNLVQNEITLPAIYDKLLTASLKVQAEKTNEPIKMETLRSLQSKVYGAINCKVSDSSNSNNDI